LIVNGENYDPRKFDLISDIEIGNLVILKIRAKTDIIYIKGNVAYAAITTAKARIL